LFTSASLSRSFIGTCKWPISKQILDVDIWLFKTL
jgi:hypothetical protein